MNRISLLLLSVVLLSPALGHADMLGLRTENRVQGGEYQAQTKGNNNVANAGSISMSGSSAGVVNNQVRATGKVSAVAEGNDNTVNSGSVHLHNSAASQVSNRVEVDSIGNTVRGNNNISNIGAVSLRTTAVGRVSSEVSGNKVQGIIDGNDNRLNIGSVDLTDHQGDVMTKTDLGNVSVSMSGDKGNVAIDSVVSK